MKKSHIEIFKTKDNKIELKVNLDSDTVWLNQKQMSHLFGKDRNTISEHIQNIFKEKELQEDSVTRKFRSTASDGKKYNTKFYNLDVIISVGYRVKSQRGTQFRIWASNVLRAYLVEGYAINVKQLKSTSVKYIELREQILTLRKVIDNEEFTLNQSKELVRIISDYTSGLELLEKIDNNKVDEPDNLNISNAIKLDYERSKDEINVLRVNLKAHSLFGNEKDNGFKSAIVSIFQTFDGKELYPSIEEKAANLLYFIIKNHPFTDGNKRIGSFMFIRFLDMNNLLYTKSGKRIIEENTLVAIALLIAQSDPQKKDLMVRIVINLIKL